MSETVPNQCRFFMPHPDSGVMIPVSQALMATLPLTTFLKKSYYRLDDGSFIQSLKAASGTDLTCRQQFHNDLLAQLI